MDTLLSRFLRECLLLLGDHLFNEYWRLSLDGRSYKIGYSSHRQLSRKVNSNFQEVKPQIVLLALAYQIGIPDSFYTLFSAVTAAAALFPPLLR